MGDKVTKLKNWFFKGRIEKKILEDIRIDELSKEYNEGKIVEIVKWKK